MSKWTLIRKTEATRFDRLQNLWEGCFKMKGDHCKNQGALRISLQILMRKWQVQFVKEQPSHAQRNLAGTSASIL